MDFLNRCGHMVKTQILWIDPFQLAHFSEIKDLKPLFNNAAPIFSHYI